MARSIMHPSNPESGQASVEYLLVGLVLIAMIVAVGALWQFVSGGALTGLVEAHTSHALTKIGGIVDALMF